MKKLVSRLLIVTILLALNSGYLSNRIVLATSNSQANEYMHSSTTGEFLIFGSTLEMNGGYRLTVGGNSYVRTPLMTNIKQGDDVKVIVTIEGSSGSNSNIYVKNTGIYKEIRSKNLGYSAETHVLVFKVKQDIVSYQRFLEIAIGDGNDGDTIDVKEIKIYVNNDLLIDKSTSSVSGSGISLQEEPSVSYIGISSDEYPIAAGEKGVVDSNYPYGHVHRYGAVGDGVTDDVEAFRLAFSQNDVVTMETKTYLWDDGAYMYRDQVINGNGATIITGKNFSPTGDFNYGLLRYRYADYMEGTQGKYEINDLSIHWNSSFTRNGDFVIFYPLGYAEVILNHVNITSESGNKTRLQLMYATEGTSKYYDCNFINRSQGISGGVLWLNNMDESNIPKIYASQTVMVNYCSDELLALYGYGGYDLLFEDCELRAYNTYLLKDTLMMAFYGGTYTKYNGAKLNCNAKFVRTTIECHDDESKENHLVTMIGAGTNNWNRKNSIEFEDCKIVNNSFRNFASAWYAREDMSNYNDPNHTHLKFTQSEIILKTAISGNLSAFVNKEAGSSNQNVSMEFYNCDISARYGLVDASNLNTLHYDFVMDNCDVDIKDTIGLLKYYQKDSSSIKITNNRIKTDKEVEMIIYSSIAKSRRMPKDGYEKIYIVNNKLNGVSMETFY